MTTVADNLPVLSNVQSSDSTINFMGEDIFNLDGADLLETLLNDECVSNLDCPCDSHIQFVRRHCIGLLGYRIHEFPSTSCIVLDKHIHTVLLVL